MHFTVPVPADVHELEFSWQSLIAYPVSVVTPAIPKPSMINHSAFLQLPYAISIEYNTDQEALGTPTLSIPHKGLVPQEIESFLVYLPCTGNASLIIPLLFAGSGIATFNIRRSLRKNKQQQLELEAGKHPGHHSAPTPFGSGE